MTFNLNKVKDRFINKVSDIPIPEDQLDVTIMEVNDITQSLSNDPFLTISCNGNIAIFFRELAIMNNTFNDYCNHYYGNNILDFKFKIINNELNCTIKINKRPNGNMSIMDNLLSLIDGSNIRDKFYKKIVANNKIKDVYSHICSINGWDISYPDACYNLSIFMYSSTKYSCGMLSNKIDALWHCLYSEYSDYVTLSKRTLGKIIIHNDGNNSSYGSDVEKYMNFLKTNFGSSTLNLSIWRVPVSEIQNLNLNDEVIIEDDYVVGYKSITRKEHNKKISDSILNKRFFGYNRDLLSSLRSLNKDKTYKSSKSESSNTRSTRNTVIDNEYDDVYNDVYTSIGILNSYQSSITSNHDTSSCSHSHSHDTSSHSSHSCSSHSCSSSSCSSSSCSSCSS